MLLFVILFTIRTSGEGTNVYHFLRPSAILCCSFLVQLPEECEGGVVCKVELVTGYMIHDAGSRIGFLSLYPAPCPLNPDFSRYFHQEKQWVLILYQ